MAMTSVGMSRSGAAARHWGWDEDITPFPEYVERSNPQAHRYLAELSEERGVEIKPRLSAFWTFLLATRLPFLTATIIPILLGIAVAGNDGEFNLWLAFVTIVAGATIHIGLNVANDVFDALSGADEANYRPTQYSGGSRVIQRGIVPLARMITISAAGYTVGGGLGLYLVLETGSVELLAIGITGVLLSVFYTAPPLRLVHRGLGELTTAIGFGPVMVLGAYVVQTGELAWEPFVASMPVAILIALVLYVNEIPDRGSDASVGKRTLPVRLSRETVITGFLVASIAAFGTVVAGVVAGLLPTGTLISLLALPLALQVHAGIRKHYESPYELMPIMGRNVQLHLATGLLLFAGYILAIAI
jgi:1,4-dihydroxy-2-naphthoate octaprenyltransferase